MKLACILVVGVLFNAGFLAAISPDVASVARSTLNAIQVSSKVLHLFKDQQKYIPAQAFKGASQLQGAVETYLQAEQSVYEWCGVAVERFGSYLRLLERFSKGKARMQQRMVLQMLEVAVNKFTLAQEQLERAAGSFAEAGEPANLIAKAVEKINQTKAQLGNEINALGQVKGNVAVALDKIKDIEDISELDDVIENEIKIPVGRLMEECSKFREQYTVESETFHAE